MYNSVFLGKNLHAVSVSFINQGLKVLCQSITKSQYIHYRTAPILHFSLYNSPEQKKSDP